MDGANVQIGTTLRENGAKLSDRVAIELGTRIVQGQIAPHSRLPTEAELCDLFGVSRSVIRDAVRTLSARGLVEVRQGHGIVTSEPTDVPFSEALIMFLMRAELSVRDVLEARAAIETELAPLAAERGTDEDWAVLRASLERYDAAITTGDWAGAQESHLNFHYSLFAATRLPALRLLMKPMQQIILVSSVPVAGDEQNPAGVWTRDDLELHFPILDALVARDRDGVREAMEVHFARTAERLRDGHESGTLFRESEGARALLRSLLTA
jgi:GntR family transcriptional repressor for pyruvate dehydrogenase complex